MWSLTRLLSSASSTSSTSSPLSRSSPLLSSSLDFGLMLDIDGVLCRGKRVIPAAVEAFSLLKNENSKLRVPVVFVTNAGNSLRQAKADQLSQFLNVQISQEQVVMSHSPLRLFQDYHQKHVLISGQGPIHEIAANLGFRNVTSVEDLRHSFPTLDAIDHKRRRFAPCAFEAFFPRMEAIVLFGEPVRWETNLQLIIDTLITDGQPHLGPKKAGSTREELIKDSNENKEEHDKINKKEALNLHYPYPHLPVLACNMDLQWMAESRLPRFGHGAFMLCLENLYQKITGRELVYSALVGKPSEITYRHAEQVLQQVARDDLGMSKGVSTIYAIGDNVCTDIFGANLYNRYLQQKRQQKDNEVSLTKRSRFWQSNEEEQQECLAQNCYSILVETGVYEKEKSANLSHSPRDFLPVEDSYQHPTHVATDILHALHIIMEEQGIH